MIETIPNPLADKGVQKDIQDKVSELMARPTYKNVVDTMQAAIQKAAEWGISEGFRMGWRIHENRERRA